MPIGPGGWLSLGVERVINLSGDLVGVGRTTKRPEIGQQPLPANSYCLRGLYFVVGALPELWPVICE